MTFHQGRIPPPPDDVVDGIDIQAEDRLRVDVQTSNIDQNDQQDEIY